MPDFIIYFATRTMCLRHKIQKLSATAWIRHHATLVYCSHFFHKSTDRRRFNTHIGRGLSKHATPIFQLIELLCEVTFVFLLLWFELSRKPKRFSFFWESVGCFFYSIRDKLKITLTHVTPARGRAMCINLTT